MGNYRAKRVPGRERGKPLPDGGSELVAALLAEIDEEERLSAVLGVDLAPADPDPSHAPRIYLSLEDWFERSEESHRMLRARKKRYLASAEYPFRGTLEPRDLLATLEQDFTVVVR